jgi:predicted ATPase/Tfp pilus assembly protein PilF
MRLRTLGKVALEHTEFTRPKPLLLLAYLALEGRQERRHVAELFWPGAADRMKSLTVALTRLRKGAPGSIDADDHHVWATVDADAQEFLALLDRGDPSQALDLYRGPFLAGFYLKHWSTELEEWIYDTREHLAARARRAMLELAERPAARERFHEASRLAEAAFRLPGAAALEPDEIVRLHTLLVAGDSPLASGVRREASGFGIDLATSPADARERLRRLFGAPGTTAPHNLPKRSTALVGRDLELTDVATLLARPDCPLLTLVGPAGVGKTRLAVQAAHDQHALGAFPGGVYFVALEPLSSARSLASAVASALAIELAGPEEPMRRIIDHIGEREMLLVLDNAEHILARSDGTAAAGEDVASVITDLVAACPDLTLLVTSRARLDLEEERTFPVAGLPYPQRDQVPLDEARRFDAVELFVRRAKRARADFDLGEENVADVLRLCRIVEGLPLALELAAVWVRIMPVDEIVTALEDGLDILATPTRNVPERHRSMRAAFDQSWRLLPPKEQQVLRRLAVFRGGFRREAAREVAGATIPVLAALVDTSLLRVDATGRYDSHPFVHEYALERLAHHPEEHAQAEERHRAYFVRSLQVWEDELAGGARQREALAAVEGELENVLLAWRGAADDGDVALLWDACRPLQVFFIQRGGLLREAAAAFTDAARGVEELAGDPGRALLGRLLVAEAWFRFLLGETARSEAAAQRGVASLRTVADAAATGDASSRDADRGRRLAIDRGVTSGLNTLGHIAKQRGDLSGAERHFRAALALARAWDNRAQVAIMTNNVALLRKSLGDYDEAETLFREALAINRGRKNDRSIVRNLTNLGSLMVVAGKGESAERLLREGARLAAEIGYEDLVPSLLSNLGGAAYLRGRYEEAGALYREALERKRDSGERAFLADAHCGLGRVEAARGAYAEARHHLGAALALAWEAQYVEIVCASLLTLAELSNALGEPTEAAALVGALGGQSALTQPLAARVDALVEELSALPSPEAPRAALERGATMPLDQVVASVLQGATPRP